MSRIRFGEIEVVVLQSIEWNVRATADGALLDGSVSVQALTVPKGGSSMTLVPRHAEVFAKAPANMHLGCAAVDGHVRVGPHPCAQRIDVHLTIGRQGLARLTEARRGKGLNLFVQFQFDIFADGVLVDYASESTESTISRDAWLDIVHHLKLAQVFVLELPLPVAPGEHSARVIAQFGRALESWERHDYTSVLIECRKAHELLETHAPLKHARIAALMAEDPASKAKKWTMDERMSVASGSIRQLLNAGAHSIDRAPTADEAAFAIAATAAVLRLHANSLRLDATTVSPEADTCE